jgi:LEA14-like dessication related protein
MSARVRSYLVTGITTASVTIPDDRHPFTDLPGILREQFLHDPWTKEAEMHMKSYIAGYIHRLVDVGLIDRRIEDDLVRFLQQSIHAE